MTGFFDENWNFVKSAPTESVETCKILNSNVSKEKDVCTKSGSKCPLAETYLSTQIGSQVYLTGLPRQTPCSLAHPFHDWMAVSALKSEILEKTRGAIFGHDQWHMFATKPTKSNSK